MISGFTKSKTLIGMARDGHPIYGEHMGVAVCVVMRPQLTGLQGRNMWSWLLGLRHWHAGPYDSSGNLVTAASGLDICNGMPDSNDNYGEQGQYCCVGAVHWQIEVWAAGVAG